MADQSVDFEVLEWDSAFFGFKVAKIKSSVLGADDLGALLDRLKAQDVALVYWPADSKDPGSEQAAARWEGFLADEKRTYRASWEAQTNPGPLPPEISLYNEAPVSDILLALAERSGLYSRFKMDPRFPRALFEGLYHSWVQKAAAGKDGEKVWVYRLDGKMVGMVTVGPMGGRSAIGLIAVAPGFEGRGIGRGLVGAARRWSLENHFKTGQVVTQSANRAACGLYEHCGYELEKTERFYHFWLRKV